jgi:zinc D-Ala-D-Ala carboxypeptidase
MKITTSFTWREATHSDTATRNGIDNMPSDEKIIENISATAEKMETVRRILGGPVVVSSWYRCGSLNFVVGGSESSAHTKGLAVDFTCPSFGNPDAVVRALAKHNRDALGFDQLIYERNDAGREWVHIGWPPSEGEGRGQVLSAVAGRNPKYTAFKV